LNNNKLINPKLICAFCWFVLFFNYENARSKKQNYHLLLYRKIAQFWVVASSNGKQYMHYTCLMETGLPLDSPRLTGRQCQVNKDGLDTVNVFGSVRSV